MDTVSMLNKMSFYCQPILPLVYDESMSYYETLCKVVGQLNTTGDTVNKLNEGLTGEIADRQAADVALDERLKVVEEADKRIHFLVFVGANPNSAMPTRTELWNWVRNGDIICALYSANDTERGDVYAASCTYNAGNWETENSSDFHFLIPLETTYDSTGKLAVKQKIVKLTIPSYTKHVLTVPWGEEIIEINTPHTSAEGIVNFSATVDNNNTVHANLSPAEFTNLYRAVSKGSGLIVGINAQLTTNDSQLFLSTTADIIGGETASDDEARIVFDAETSTGERGLDLPYLNRFIYILSGSGTSETWTLTEFQTRDFAFDRDEGFQFTRAANNVITPSFGSTPKEVAEYFGTVKGGVPYQNLPVHLIDNVDNAEYWNGVFDRKSDGRISYTFTTSYYRESKMLVRIIELSATPKSGSAFVGDEKWVYAEKEFELPFVIDTAMSDTSTNPVQNKVVKAALDGKFDKTGGKIEGNAEITGFLNVGMSAEFSSSIQAQSEITSDLLLMAPIVALRDPATEKSISLGVSGENAAKVTSPVSGGGVQYARLKVASPTEDNDAATKKYVDDHSAGGATDAQVEAAVSTWLTDHPEATTTVQDGAITKEKIHDNAVGAHELDIDFSNNISTLPDNPNVIKVATGWESTLSSLRQSQTYPNGVLWAFHCEAGKCYRLQQPYMYNSTRASLFTQANPDNVSNINDRGRGSFICDQMISPKAGGFNTQDGYIAGAWYFGLPQGLDPVYATIFNNVSTSYDRAEFRCEKDFWMYWLSASDVSADVPYIGGSDSAIREIPEPPQAVLENGGWFTTTASNSSTYIAPYSKSFSGFAKEKTGGETSEDSVHGIRRYVLSKDISGAVARSSRDPADYRINAVVIGDSITYAASNAGLQNAWRKYISTRLNIGEIDLAVSGTGIIKGAPYDFKGNAKGSEAYSEDMSGYPGIVHWANSYLGKESTFQFPGTNTYERNLLMQRVSIAIVALGTNDWSANSTLGSVDTIGDETTFYGAVQKTYTFLHDEVGIPCVLFVAPFKRNGWSQPNQATTPYTIYDMCHALSEIACINTDMYVLDCLDRWYLNYDDETIRSRSFIDGAHIKPYAHHLFTIDLAK